VENAIIFDHTEGEAYAGCPFCMRAWVENEYDYDSHLDGPGPCQGEGTIGEVLADVDEDGSDVRRAIIADRDGDLWKLINDYSQGFMTLEPIDIEYARWYVKGSIENHRDAIKQWRNAASNLAKWEKRRSK
jgi:hypothetical protein